MTLPEINRPSHQALAAVREARRPTGTSARAGGMMSRMDQSTRAVIYTRQSLDQTGSGAAVARQEEACRGLAVARGWNVVAVESDNSISASTGKARPGWEAVLGMVERDEVDVILAYHLDRITRTMTDLEHLITATQSRGVGVATATGDIDLTTDTGRMVARILAAVARQEVERKGARQALANRQRVALGKPRWGRRPFGYERDGSLREGEAEHLREAYRLVLAGHRQADIVRAWNGAGITTANGGQWSTQTVGNLLRDPRNAGIITYHDEEQGRGDWEPVVDEDTFRVAVARLSNGRPGSGGRRGGSNALLVTVATCDECGGNLFTNRDRASEDPEARVYVCQTGHTNAPTDAVEGIVLRRLADALASPEHASRWAQEQAEQGDERAELRARLALLRERAEALATDYAEGLLSREQMLSGTDRVREQIATAEADLARVEADVVPTPFDVERFYEEFEALDLAEQRQTVRSVFSSVAVKRRGRGSRVPFGSEHVLTVVR